MTRSASIGLLTLIAALGACSDDEPSAGDLKASCNAACEHINTCSTSTPSDCADKCSDSSIQAAIDRGCASETNDAYLCQKSANACTAEDGNGPCGSELGAVISCAFGL